METLTGSVPERTGSEKNSPERMSGPSWPGWTWRPQVVNLDTELGNTGNTDVESGAGRERSSSKNGSCGRTFPPCFEALPDSIRHMEVVWPDSD